MYIFKKASDFAIETRVQTVKGKLGLNGNDALFYGSRHYAGGKFSVIHHSQSLSNLLVGMLTAPTIGEFIERAKPVPVDLRNVLMSVFVAACDDLPYSMYASKHGINIKNKREELSKAHLTAIKGVYSEILASLNRNKKIGIVFTQE